MKPGQRVWSADGLLVGTVVGCSQYFCDVAWQNAPARKELTSSLRLSPPANPAATLPLWTVAGLDAAGNEVSLDFEQEQPARQALAQRPGCRLFRWLDGHPYLVKGTE